MFRFGSRFTPRSLPFSLGHFSLQGARKHSAKGRFPHKRAAAWITLASCRPRLGHGVPSAALPPGAVRLTSVTAEMARRAASFSGPPPYYSFTPLFICRSDVAAVEWRVLLLVTAGHRRSCRIFPCRVGFAYARTHIGTHPHTDGTRMPAYTRHAITPSLCYQRLSRAVHSHRAAVLSTHSGQRQSQ